MNDIDLKIAVTEDGQSIVELLHGASGLSKTRIKDAMSKGAVWLTRSNQRERIRRAKAKAQSGDAIRFYYNEQILSQIPPVPTLIEDNRHYSVWHKPRGLASSGTRFGDHCTVYRWIETFWDRPTFLVHRLDRFASGLILLAHRKSTAAMLARQFEQRETHKLYRVIVEGVPDANFICDAAIDGKQAISHVSLLASKDNRSLLTVKIDTGRKHQIRKHLAAAGYPVIGDRRYGNSTGEDKEDEPPELQLTAVELGFICPITGQARHYTLTDEYQLTLS